MPVSNPASVTGPYALPVCSGPHHIPICTAAAHMPMCTTQPTWSLPGACNFAGIPACGIQHLPSCGLAQVSKTTEPPLSVSALDPVKLGQEKMVTQGSLTDFMFLTSRVSEILSVLNCSFIRSHVFSFPLII